MTGELLVEQALFEPLATGEQMQKFCDEAIHLEHHSIAVPSSRVELVYEWVGDSEVKVSCLVGFPFGTADADVKRFETEVAVDNGAHEINLMASLSHLKEGDYARVLREIRDVVEAADERPVKIFVEPHLLSARELEETVRMVLDSGARFMATTLWSSIPVMEEVRRLRELVGDKFGVIASTANEDIDPAALIDAGANRLMIAKVGQSGRGRERAFGI